jgi:membrane protein YdbS with pleckstrin-like domain
MKATENKPLSGKLTMVLILAVIGGGMGLLYSVADLEPGSGIMASLFIAFLGAIIAVQVIPAMMLFGMILKGVAGMFRKEDATKASH